MEEGVNEKKNKLKRKEMMGEEYDEEMEHSSVYRQDSKGKGNVVDKKANKSKQ